MVLEKTLESPLDSTEIQPVNPKRNHPWIFIRKTDVLKLKLQYFGHLMWRTESFERTLILERLRLEEKGTRENEMVGWNHWLKWHEFEQALEFGDGQRSLACCSPWGCKESDKTEWLNWTELICGIKKKDINELNVQNSLTDLENKLMEGERDRLWNWYVHTARLLKGWLVG